ncbi:methyltransferase [uncultured Ilyobacter sp.]|uniref:tRNA1(Val) (adenine(37)-N6)-methyltransferase n=1 Tax=uncultured Ilyobacter sp. TaxID=544433 RepID=UPI0029C80022|nr:methyltransferase [uncultured Ilyobacter sp.]
MIRPDEDITLLDEMGRDIIQKKNGFRFSVDAVILADFFKGKKPGKLLEIGTGTGIISILLSDREEIGKITALEVQPEMAELAERNMIRNGLKGRIEVVLGDVKEMKSGNMYDYVISNPPYMPLDGKKINMHDNKALSRHEINLTLEELVKNAKRLLKPRGQFFVVHRTHRFSDIACIFEREGFSLKRVKFVYSDNKSSSNLVLIEASKGRKEILEVEQPLYLNS